MTVRAGKEAEVRDWAAAPSSSVVERVHRLLGIWREFVFLEEVDGRLVIYLVIEGEDLEAVQQRAAAIDDAEGLALLDRTTSLFEPPDELAAMGSVIIDAREDGQ
jgi:hypothetical protein